MHLIVPTASPHRSAVSAPFRAPTRPYRGASAKQAASFYSLRETIETFSTLSRPIRFPKKKRLQKGVAEPDNYIPWERREPRERREYRAALLVYSRQTGARRRPRTTATHTTRYDTTPHDILARCGEARRSVEFFQFAYSI